MLHVINARVARDLHTIALGPLERTCGDGSQRSEEIVVGSFVVMSCGGEWMWAWVHGDWCELRFTGEKTWEGQKGVNSWAERAERAGERRQDVTVCMCVCVCDLTAWLTVWREEGKTGKNFLLFLLISNLTTEIVKKSRIAPLNRIIIVII